MIDNDKLTQRISTGRASPRRLSTEQAKTVKLYSKTLPDPFSSDYSTSTEGGYDIIAPPVNPRVLHKLVQDNAYLKQCVDAMVTNIAGFGYTLQFVGDQSQDEVTASDKEAKKEQQYLEELFDDPSPFFTYQEILNKIHTDKQIFANAYIEVVRDPAGRVIQVNHLPAITVRITKIDPEPVIVTTKIRRGGKDVSLKSYKHFRRFVQIKSDGYTKVYFKEFGDPRSIDPRTGKVNPNLTVDEAATEIIHYSEYNPNSIYGVPGWYTQLPSIIGSRQSELTNLDFFENNAIPALAVLVAGGLLTEDTVDLLENNFSNIKGRGSINKVAILEASPNMDAVGQSGSVPTPTIKLEPLYAQRQQDATFQDYDASCAQKIMSSFRLPPVYVAGSKDYTYACHSDRTSVVTSTGKVKFTDVDNTDLDVITYCPKTNSYIPNKPTAFHKYWFTGKLVRFINKITLETVLEVTGNHTVMHEEFGAWESKTASELLSRYHSATLPSPDGNIETSIDTIDYEGYVYCFTVPTGYFVTSIMQDVTSGNSANKSVEVAETQTFIPERKAFDDLWNRTIVKSWGSKFWRYRTNNSRISSPTDIVNAIATFTDAGAITPNIAIGILNEALNLDIPESDKIYGNIPSKLLESILRGAGGEDKTNLIVNAIKILNEKDAESLQPITIQTPGNADAITDPVNDPGDAPKGNNQGRRNDLRV